MPHTYLGSTPDEVSSKLREYENLKGEWLVKEIDKNKIKRQRWFEQFEKKYRGKLARELCNLD